MESRKRREGGSHYPGPSNSRNSVSGSLFSIRSSELRPMGMADPADMRCRCDRSRAALYTHLFLSFFRSVFEFPKTAYSRRTLSEFEVGPQPRSRAQCRLISIEHRPVSKDEGSLGKWTTS